jgi:NAD(P)-dependent dehydrogenase (short-subunit alcohol dehydrogenase family)
MSGQLEGQTVLVTGAAAGIGRSMAELFSQEGARVVAVDLHEQRLAAVERDVPGTTGVVADITTADGLDAAMAATDGGPDVLCNNAGVIDRLLAVDEVSEQDWDQLMAVNLRAPFLLCRRAIPAMLERGGGCIVNTASVAGLRGGRSGAAYTASKWGLVGLTQNIAVTHGPRGIRCNAICPGGVITSIHENVELGEQAQRIRDRDREKPPRAHPEEIASVAVWLATPAAGRLNGTAIPVDAGFIAY